MSAEQLSVDESKYSLQIFHIILKTSNYSNKKENIFFFFSFEKN